MARANRHYIPGHIRAKGREVRGMEGQFELREPEVTYNSHFEAKKVDIGPKNTYFWNDNIA